MSRAQRSQLGRVDTQRLGESLRNGLPELAQFRQHGLLLLRKRSCTGLGVQGRNAFGQEFVHDSGRLFVAIKKDAITSTVSSFAKGVLDEPPEPLTCPWLNLHAAPPQIYCTCLKTTTRLCSERRDIDGSTTPRIGRTDGAQWRSDAFIAAGLRLVERMQMGDRVANGVSVLSRQVTARPPIVMSARLTVAAQSEAHGLRCETRCSRRGF